MIGGLVSGLLAVGVLPPGVPQEPRPPAGSAGHVWPPAFHERSLRNGARLLVVPREGLPFVRVDLVLPGGRTADPPGRAGLADLTASLLTRGTRSRTAAEVAELLDARGAELDVSVGADWTTVGVSVLTPHLPAVLELMADIVLNPSFPAAELERARERALAELRAAAADPARVADRTFLRVVYGEHPYGRLPTPGSLAAVDRSSVLAYHRAWYGLPGALFVVSGDVEPNRAMALLEGAFAGGRPAHPPDVQRGLPPLRHAPSVVLVHLPGAVRATLRVGQTVPAGSDSGWPAMRALAHLLGGGSGSRLARAFRERALGPPPSARVQRRLDRGLLLIAAEVPTDRAGDAVEELYRQIVEVREGGVSVRALREARGRLAGAFLVRTETAQQAAAELASARLLGVQDSALAAWPARMERLDPYDVQQVAARWIQPGELVFVVVGDAALLRGQLTTFGEPTIVDTRGDPLDPAALRPRGRTGVLDASTLGPLETEYRVSVRGRTVGTVVRTLEAEDDEATMVFRSRARVGLDQVVQSVTFSVPDFEPVAASSRVWSGGDTVSLEVAIGDGHAVGRHRSPGAPEEPIDRPLPPGAVVADMAELVPRMLRLELGTEVEVPFVQIETGVAAALRYTVVGVEEVNVPAGTFRAWRVEVSGAESRTVWVREGIPRVPVRISPTTSPAVLELVSWRTPGEPREPGRRGPGA